MESIGLIVFMIAVFAATVAMILGIFMLWNAYRGPEARRLSERLRAASAAGAEGGNREILKSRVETDAAEWERLLLQLPRAGALDRLVVQSGSKLTVVRFLVLTLVFAVGGWLIAGLAFRSLLLAAPVAFIAGVLPAIFLQRRRGKRMSLIEAQLPDALDFIARGMLAGHSFSTALAVVGEEGPPNIRGEFKAAYDEVNYGIAMEDALRNLAARVPTADMRIFVAAVVLQRETGGNLAELLGNIARIVRERTKLYGRVRVLTAEGRMSAWILILLPFVIGGLFTLINPGFVSLLWTDPLGIRLVSANLVMMAFGVLWMWKIIQIRV